MKVIIFLNIFFINLLVAQTSEQFDEKQFFQELKKNHFPPKQNFVLNQSNWYNNEIGIDRQTKFGDLKDSQIEKIQEVIDKVGSNAPKWMLNHRKDYETGEDIHLIGTEIEMHLRDEINIMKKIRSYRGIRHERGLPVRGQRTRANNRKGLALGVSKKRETKPSKAG